MKALSIEREELKELIEWMNEIGDELKGFEREEDGYCSYEMEEERELKF